ncbi:acyltransferase family protein [Persicitalea jodogahamensis]|uniref:acyltransferase family protein n=1 Tax=Persicitalea jodogahamensis TaxID=402147 RepID=UPI0016785F35|nr:acyltransferase [Persicitalea jodogahamensis]
MTQKNRLLELDALRGIAAVSVMIFHYSINENAGKLGWEFRYGVTGVDLFFMISGFVITLSIQKIKKWQDFAVFRFARLYPTFWACVLITTLAILFYEPASLSVSQFLANLTMFPVYFGIENIDQVYWTLLVEMVFYLWILAVWLAGGMRHIVTIGFLFLVGVVFFHALGHHYPTVYHFLTLKVQFLNHFPLFYTGILFYQLKFRSFSWRYLALICVGMVAAFYLHDKGGRSMYHTSVIEHDLLIAFYHLLFLMFVFGKLSFLVNPTLLFLGKISYSLYLLHQYVGLHLIATFNETLGLNIYVAEFLTVGIIVLLSYLVTVFVEDPAISRIKNWYRAREHRQVEEPDAARTALP